MIAIGLSGSKDHFKVGMLTPKIEFRLNIFNLIAELHPNGFVITPVELVLKIAANVFG